LGANRPAAKLAKVVSEIAKPGHGKGLSCLQGRLEGIGSSSESFTSADRSRMSVHGTPSNRK
jgi:hypothetical protein